jgi:hypothetical protein
VLPAIGKGGSSEGGHHAFRTGSRCLQAPEYQHPKAGDIIPIGSDATTRDDFYVHHVDPFRALVIGANDSAFQETVSWAMVLIPVGANRTRLVVRVRGDIPRGARGLAMYALLEPEAFIMLRKQMLNFKRLAERTYEERLHRSA